ncbi:MAG TPA: peptidoglycan DD-metalloendopeptidase family protein [Cyclobacteriaceae bacterium]|nr:peptidoglycan DD-metalloendopeptidase family protein [Cyclobacteriaceae bacterium]
MKQGLNNYSKWFWSAACVAVIGTGYFLFSYVQSVEAEDASTADVTHVEQQVSQAPTLLYGIAIDGLHIITNVVKRNQRFTDLLSGYYVSPRVQQQLSLLPRETFDFRKISADKKYTLITETDSVRSVRALVYESNPIDYYVFYLQDSMRMEAGHHEVMTVEKEVAGVIGSSLSETIDILGISHELTNRFVDIFAWQIDFQRLQKGDRFKLFYEEKQVEGYPIGIGKISGIYFQHFDHPFYAIPFKKEDGIEYYDEEGKSLRKALLKYPIEFTRIGSRYNLRRFHPIDKVYRPHLGTDFSAPTGTPIRSVGDGIVVEAQYKSRNGNYVKVRHNSVYTTQYLHMSKIGAGIKPGVKVKQGETIGYVGSTGLSTGPHLHYSFWQNGVQVDALRVELPPSLPIQQEDWPLFNEERIKVIKRLEKIQLPEPPVIVAAN